MAEAAKRGILVMAYGSPNKIEDIEPYYTDIRRGHKPSPELLAELTARYKAIGGSSPLLMITNAQAASLQKEMDSDYKVYVGMRHWMPWIGEAVKQMKEECITQAVGIVMAPHYSGMSIAKYMEKVEEANINGERINFKFVESWHDHPLYIEALADKVKEKLSDFTAEEKKDLCVIFTAHSLPERILKDNDPYKDQLLETSELVAKKAGVSRWKFAFQSAGRTKEKWLGPDLLEVIEELENDGVKSILVCSVGFITDHLEVMYDIDVEAQAEAKKKGIHLERTASLNDEPRLAKLFAELIRKKFNEF